MSKSLRGRFSDIIWAKAAGKYRILIVGLGGIGSWLTLFLARIGYTLHICDFDMVADHNIGGQLYDIGSTGTQKTAVTRRIVQQLTSYYIPTSHTKEYDSSMIQGMNIVVAAVDKMEIRRQMYNDWKAQVEKVKLLSPPTTPTINLGLFVDGRMNAEQFEIYFVTFDRIKQYEPTLFDDSEVPEELCTNKATSHFGAGIAFNITKGINNYVALLEGEPRELPFRYQEEGYLFTRSITTSEDAKHNDLNITGESKLVAEQTESLS